MSEPVNVLTGMDYWLDNLMCNVPELAMCYHLNGIVQVITRTGSTCTFRCAAYMYLFRQQKFCISHQVFYAPKTTFYPSLPFNVFEFYVLKLTFILNTSLVFFIKFDIILFLILFNKHRKNTITSLY